MYGTNLTWALGENNVTDIIKLFGQITQEICEIIKIVTLDPN